MIQAVVFDIDNTLTHDVSWLRITELLGASVTTHETIFRQFSDGALPYDQAKSQLIDLWQATGKAQKQYWEQLFRDWPLVAGSHETVGHLRQKGYEVAVITGSLDIFAQAIAQKLQINHWYANTSTVWDAAGNLTDFHYVQDQAAQKALHLQELCVTLGLQPTDCAAIGDGINDIDLFRTTQHGIAVAHAAPELQTIAWKQITDLSDLQRIL